MKKQHSNRNILAVISVCILLAFTAMAFQDSTKINMARQHALLDTPPKNQNVDIEINLNDFEKNMQKSMELVEKSMKGINWDNISKQVQESMKHLDMAKLEMDIKKSMKDIDFNKMKMEIDRSMKDIDFDKMKLEIDRSMKDINLDKMKIDMDKMKKEINESMKDINMDDLKKEMEKVKKEMDINKDQFRLEMDKAKEEMLKAKAGLIELKEMTSEMEKDGLINKKENNNIEFKDKELYINGKKQSQEMTEKYRKYFNGNNFRLKSDK